jgi:hypothetical protein
MVHSDMNVLEERSFCPSDRFRFRLQQHLVAEQRGCNADVQTIHTNLIHVATVPDADVVVRMGQETGSESSSFGAHHQDGGVLCNRAVIGGKPFIAASNGIHDITGIVVSRFGSGCRDGGSWGWGYRATGIDPPASS